MKSERLLEGIGFLLGGAILGSALGVAAPPATVRNAPSAGAEVRAVAPTRLPPARRVPVIDVTDLYHPHQDVGDNFDLITAYALPEVDLRAVVLDCTEPFRQPVARSPGAGLFEDPDGPRDPGFIPVLQLNYLFNRAVPVAAGPFSRMKSPEDTLRDVPAFQQHGVELLLRTLRESAEPVHIVSFGSARPIAAALNREPKLFRRKLAQLHLCAGASAPGFLEWNVALDPNAIVCVLRSGLPIALYPCAANNQRGAGEGSQNAAFSYDSYNTFYKLPDSLFIQRMAPPLRRYLDFAYGRTQRADYLRALDVETSTNLVETAYRKEHYIWETAVWLCVTGRKLVRHADGRARIVAAHEVRSSDRVLPTELLPCTVAVAADGRYTVQVDPGNRVTNLRIHYRGDPRENERALQEALPALYESFRP